MKPSEGSGAEGELTAPHDWGGCRGGAFPGGHAWEFDHVVTAESAGAGVPRVPQRRIPRAGPGWPSRASCEEILRGFLHQTLVHQVGQQGLAELRAAAS